MQRKDSSNNYQDGIVTGISDDIRKSILFDVIKITRDESNKRLIVILTVLIIFITVLTYYGYETLTKQLAQEVYNKEFNPDLIAKIDKTENELNNILEKALKVEKQLIERETELEEKINLKRQELINLTQMITSFEISNASIENVINHDNLTQISDYDGFQFIYPLGLSDTTIFKTLIIYGDLSPIDVNKETIRQSVSMIQNRVELVSDGKLGPCTSLLLAAVSLRHFPKDTEKELRSSLYAESYWYLNVFKACYERDKEILRYALEYNDNPLHYELIRVVELIGTHKKHIINMLDSKAADKNAYDVLTILEGKVYQRHVD